MSGILDRVRIVGLTGGIGSGKSTVARMLASRGAAVIDADRLARAVVAPGTPTLAKIVERFGATFLTAEGELDRRRLGQRVFGDPEALAALNGIVHPAVAEAMQAEATAARDSGASVIVYDVPLLFENGLERMYRPVIVVTVDPEVQRDRILARDGLSPEEIEARISAQMPLSEKVARADIVIDNNGDLAATERQVDAAFAALTKDGEL